MIFNNPKTKSLLLFSAAGLVLLLITVKLLRQSWSADKAPAPSTQTSSQTTTVPTDTAKPVTTATAAADSSLAQAADPKAHEQLTALEEILQSHNDNDPRMDRDLMILSEPAKALFRQKYRQLAAEKRNDRGTIVFLLGRNLTTTADFDFLNEVMSEAPCLSLSDCSKTETGGMNRDSDEHQGGFTTALAYPQLVTLHSLEGYLQKSAQGALNDKARDIVAQAKHSTIPEVSKMADAIDSKTAH